MKEDHGLVRGITTTLVDGATMFFVGAWDYTSFVWCVWLPRLLLVCGITTSFVWCVGLSRLLLVCGITMTFVWCMGLPRLYACEFTTTLCTYDFYLCVSRALCA